MSKGVSGVKEERERMEKDLCGRNERRWIEWIVCKFWQFLSWSTFRPISFLPSHWTTSSRRGECFSCQLLSSRTSQKLIINGSLQFLTVQKRKNWRNESLYVTCTFWKLNTRALNWTPDYVELLDMRRSFGESQDRKLAKVMQGKNQERESFVSTPSGLFSLSAFSRPNACFLIQTSFQDSIITSPYSFLFSSLPFP